jgi:hypothetical protein
MSHLGPLPVVKSGNVQLLTRLSPVMADLSPSNLSRPHARTETQQTCPLPTCQNDGLAHLGHGVRCAIHKDCEHTE